MDFSTTHSLELRIYYEDTDVGGVVYHANYLKFYERGRTEWLRALGFSQQVLKDQHQLIFVVRNINVSFISPARFDETIQVKTGVREATGTRIFFEQTITSQQQVINRADVVVVCVGTENWRPKPISTFVEFNP